MKAYRTANLAITLVQLKMRANGRSGWMEQFSAMPRGWSYAYDRRVIELAEAELSIEEAARIMERSPSGLRKSSIRLGVSLKPAARPNHNQKTKTT